MNDKKTIGDVLTEVEFQIDNLKKTCEKIHLIQKAVEEDIKDFRGYKKTLEEKLKEIDNYIEYLEENSSDLDDYYYEFYDTLYDIEKSVEQFTKPEEQKENV